MSTSPAARARIAFTAFLLILGGAALAGWFALRAQQTVYEIDTADSVSGLLPGAPVEFHGVEVGKVRDIALVDARHVRIRVGLQRGTPVTSGTVATLTARGLAARGFTGYVYLSLEEARAGAPALVARADQEVPVIPSAPAQIVSLDAAMTELNGSMQSAMQLLRTTLDPQTIASLKQSAAGLAVAAHALEANSARLESITRDAERAARLAPAVMQTSEQAMAQLQGNVLPQARDALSQFSAVGASTQDAVRQAQDTLARLDQLSESLASTADRVQRDPAVLVRGTRVRPGPGETP